MHEPTACLATTYRHDGPIVGTIMVRLSDFGDHMTIIRFVCASATALAMALVRYTVTSLQRRLPFHLYS